jgi:hypothetical protein
MKEEAEGFINQTVKSQNLIPDAAQAKEGEVKIIGGIKFSTREPLKLRQK